MWLFGFSQNLVKVPTSSGEKKLSSEISLERIVFKPEGILDINPSEAKLALLGTCPCANNIIINGDFEVNVSGWNFFNGNFYRNTAFPQCATLGHGEFAYNGIPPAYGGFNQTITTISGGSSFTFKTYGGVHVNTFDATVGLLFYDVNNVFISQLTQQVDAILPNMALYTINGIVPTNATKVVIQGLTNGNFLKVDEMCLQVTACNPDNANAPPFCTPTPAACTGNTFKWSQIIDAINGNPSAVRLFCGGTLSYLIPGPYPPAFSGPVSVAIPDAVGWDGYIGRDVVTQPNERWRLVFKKSGSVVYSSNYTNDVPDFKSQAYWRGSLGTGFLPNGADQIFIEHWSVGNDASCANGPNSVVPSSVCISYSLCSMTSALLNASNGTSTTLCNGTSVTLTASSVNGALPISYLWSNGLGTGSTKTVSPSITTTYTITATDANNCTATASHTVTVNPKPVVTITGNQIICNGSNTTFTANPSGGTTPYSYLWSNGSTSAAIAISTAGTYSVTVTDSKGCTATASRILTVNAKPVVKIDGNNIICAGGSTVFTASPSNGTAPYTYLWSNSATTQSITISSAGNYIVTVTDANGCTGTSSRTLTVNSKPTVTISGNNNPCAGQPTTFTANPSGGTAPYTYLWSTGATTQMITVSTLGTYTVTVTDFNGCTGSASVTLTQKPKPLAKIDGLTNVCQGSTVTFTAYASSGTPPYTYLWSTGATTDFIVIGTAGTYTVTVTDINGCTGTASRTLTVNPIPTTTVSGTNIICSGSSTVFTANPSGGTPGYTYLWSNSATTQSITVSTTGTYFVTVTDTKGCTATASRALTVNPSPSVVINGNTTFCEGNTSQLTTTVSGGTPGYTYLWSTGATSTFITVSTSGSYSVTVTDTKGCTASASKTVTVNPKPIVKIDGNQVICLGNSTVFTASPSTRLPLVSYRSTSCGCYTGKCCWIPSTAYRLISSYTSWG